MLFSVTILLLLSYVSAETEKIVGGSDTTITKYPYQAMLGTARLIFYPKYFCGAFVYNAQTVITSGKCCKAEPAYKIRVIAGTSYSNKDGIIRRAEKVNIHPNYTENNGIPDNDLCIITLNQPFPLSDKIQPVDGIATEADYAAGNNETITGWDSPSGSFTLQKATVQIRSTEACKNAWGTRITQNMVCASTDGTGSCQRDSGGAMVATDPPNNVAGVTSWGFGCDQPDILQTYPSVYTRVSNFASWIDDNV